MLTRLGPAYIKLGQALSIRPDLLSPVAMVELQKLCDKVPSFDSKVAYQAICDELGISSRSTMSSRTSRQSPSRPRRWARCTSRTSRNATPRRTSC